MMAGGQLRAYGLIVLTLPLSGLYHLPMHQIYDGNNMHNNARLKIWVCEFVSAGGLVHVAPPDSLLREGLLMRDALLTDLHALGVDCITSHDNRVPAPQYASSLPVSAASLAHVEDIFALWQQQLIAADVDACWVIAPETDGILQRMHALAAALDVHWIGCDEEAIRLTTDKVAMAKQCAQSEIKVISHLYLQDALPEALAKIDKQHGWVVKPLDGAGCEFTYYFKNKTQLIDFKKYFFNENPEMYGRMLVQPYIQGQALSMSVVATSQAAKVIAAHRQQVEINGNTIKFSGAEVNAAYPFAGAMQELANKIKAAIPGLHGYWGADMIATPEGELVLVEINPRLTTPYIALSALLSKNPAALVLEASLQQRLPDQVARGSQQIHLSSIDLYSGALLHG